MDFLVEQGDAGQRLDQYLPLHVEHLTRNAVQQLCGKGNVLVNERPAAKSCRVQAGDCIALLIPAPKVVETLPQDIPLEIVYEDEALLVVNKPKGMVVHPAVGNEDGTLVNALLHHCGDSLSGINGVIRPGIVHRIDKDTSGLLVVAKTDRAHQGLSVQIKEHSFRREYRAVVHGRLKKASGTVDAPVGRHPVDRKRMAVTDRGSRPARTHYQVERVYEHFTALTLRLETGRTHQIRVHMAHIGHPVAGDPVYGPKKGIRRLQGQCLHAQLLGFVHPITGEYLELSSELPPYFAEFLCWLDRQEGANAGAMNTETGDWTE